MRYPIEALRSSVGPVPNDLDATGRSLVMITGANQGGKSTFMRSVGLAQLMMQAGSFVTADAFSSSVCSGVFTHFRREEDATLTHGKLDEELDRMSALIDLISPHAMLLCNESFACTNEREGSKIALDIVNTLNEHRRESSTSPTCTRSRRDLPTSEATRWSS